MKLIFVASAFLTAFIASAVHAEPDMFGREGLYDLTGHEVVRTIAEGLATGETARASSPTSSGGITTAAATVEIRRNFVYVQDTDGELSGTIPPRNGEDLLSWFNFSLTELYRNEPDEFVFVFLFTAFDTQVGAFFYAPEANDVAGINQPPLDSNGSSPREGFIFMNQWQIFNVLYGSGTIATEQARSVFNQETGHRWGAFVTLNDPVTGELLLGRDGAHWSYFLETGGSPMEGNRWQDNQDGTFTTITPVTNWRFSDLDLYLMGLIPADEVGPFFAIANPNLQNQVDLAGQPLSAASPPQVLFPKTIAGSRVDITIDQITTSFGPRVPASLDAPRSWRSVFVMLAGQGGGLTEAQKRSFETLVDDYANTFFRATRELGQLDYVLIENPLSPIGGACAELTDCDRAESNVCLPEPMAAASFCTRGCASETTCPADWCCAQIGTDLDSDVCLPARLCPEPDAGVVTCVCDMSSACEVGCPCDPDCAPADGGAVGDGDAGVLDTGDPGSERCDCDTTLFCEEACDCDPNCGDGCGCTQASPSRIPAATGFFAAALALLHVAGRRRTRRRRGASKQP